MSHAAIDVGHTVGRYEIVSRLAAGGMAEVWLAYLHGVEGFRRCVVLKTMLPSLARRPECVKMFINEAAIAAKFNHPNIVSTFDLGRLNDSYFIAMEYLPGRSLRQLAKRSPGGRVPSWVVLHSVAAACKGLQYMHDYADDGRPLGLVHCDVSPENIIVSFNGGVTLVDFGIATTTIGGTPEDPDLIKGKFRFIAPERIRGLSMDRRADVYALGVMMYELLTGTRPYKAETPYELLARVVVGGAAPPSSVCPDIAPEIDRIVMKAMALHPEDRYAEASLLENDLAAHIAAVKQPQMARELGAYVCSVFADATDIPGGARREPADPMPPAPPRSGTMPAAKSSPDAHAAMRAPAPSECSIELSADSLEEMLGQGFARASSTSTPPPLPESRSPRRISGFQRIDTPAAMRAPAPPPIQIPAPSPVPPPPSRAPVSDPFAKRAVVDRASQRDIFACTSSREPSRASAHPFGTRPTLPTLAPQVDARPLDPASSKAALHFEVGLRLYRERRYAAALVEWEKAIELDPNHSGYRTNVRKLKSLLEGPR